MPVTPAPDVVDLDLPFAEKARAKALGARWDAERRCWYVPAGTDPAPFQAWVSPPLPPSPEGPSLPARLVLFPQACWRCQAPTTAIAGLLVSPELVGDPEGFVAFEDVAAALALLVSEELRQLWRIGEIRHRRSSVRPRGLCIQRLCGL